MQRAMWSTRCAVVRFSSQISLQIRCKYTTNDDSFGPSLDLLSPERKGHRKNAQHGDGTYDRKFQARAASPSPSPSSGPGPGPGGDSFEPKESRKNARYGAGKYDRKSNETFTNDTSNDDVSFDRNDPPFNTGRDYSDKKYNKKFDSFKSARYGGGGKSGNPFATTNSDDDGPFEAKEYRKNTRYGGGGGGGQFDDWKEQRKSSTRYGDGKYERKFDRETFDDSGADLMALDQRAARRNAKYGDGKYDRKLESADVDRHDGDLLYGIHPIACALAAKRRTVETVFYRRDLAESERVKLVLHKCWADNVETKPVVQAQTNSFFPRGQPHQGLVARVSRLAYSATSLDCLPQLAAEAAAAAQSEPSGKQIWLLLHQIQDPMNFGSIIRSAYFLGVDKIFVTAADRLAKFIIQLSFFFIL